MLPQLAIETLLMAFLLPFAVISGVGLSLTLMFWLISKVPK